MVFLETDMLSWPLTGPPLATISMSRRYPLVFSLLRSGISLVPGATWSVSGVCNQLHAQIRIVITSACRSRQSC